MPVDRFLSMALEGARQLGDPQIAWLLTDLLGIGEVVADPHTESLAIGYGRWGYDMRISPSFIEEFVADSKDALFLLLHELNHKIQGDLWIDRRRLIGPDKWEQKVANVAADMIIDRHLENMFFPDGLAVIEKLYRPGRWPEVLLASPFVIQRYLLEKGLIRKGDELSLHVVASHFASLGCTQPERAALCYLSAMTGCSLWREEWELLYCGVDFGELYLELREILKDVSFEGVTFLGDHVGECACGGLSLDPDVAGILGAQAACDQSYGRRAHLEERRVAPENPKGTKEQAMLLSAIRRAIVEDAGKPRYGPCVPVTERGVVFNPGRRELFQLASGLIPFFYPQELTDIGWSDKRIWFYVDASGSMDDMLPAIYGILSSLGEYLRYHMILMFSNKVAAMTMSEIRNGKCETTGGTDFDCVIEHARREMAKRILILTDGHGGLSDHSQRFLKLSHMELYLVLTSGDPAYSGCPLVPFASKVWGWPEK